MFVEEVGVVGLGDVGRAVAARLIELGFQVIVYDARPHEIAAAVELGARAAALPADVAEAAKVVVLAVTDETSAEEVLFDHGGVGETLCSGGVVLDASATGESFRTAATARLAEFGIRRVDVGRSVADVIGSIAA